MNTVLLIGLFFCHLLSDYTPFSTKEMLIAKSTGKPLFPIAKHAFVHFTVMFIFLTVYFSITVGTDNIDVTKAVFFACLFEFVTHFFIDTLKGRFIVWFPKFKDTTKYSHWVLFGADQYAHTIVILLMAKYLEHAIAI